jgi:hypothetical protein
MFFYFLAILKEKFSCLFTLHYNHHFYLKFKKENNIIVKGFNKLTSSQQKKS